MVNHLNLVLTTINQMKNSASIWVINTTLKSESIMTKFPTLKPLSLVALLSLTACSGLKIESTKALPPVNLVEKCSTLRAPVVGEVMENYLTYLIDEYNICAVRHDGLIEFVSPKEKGSV